MSSRCNRRCESIFPAAVGSFRQELHPFRDGSSALQSCNSHFWTPRRICTWQTQDTAPGDGRLLHTLPLLSLPFCGSQKIPQQFIFHSQTPDLICLLCNDISGFSIFSRPSLGPRHNPGFLLSLFGSLSIHKSFYDILISKAKVFCHFSLRFSGCKHGFDFRQQFLHMRIISFTHSNTP